MNLYSKFISVAGIQALSLCILFLLHVLMTRLLGPETYGTYIYIFSWVSVAAILGKFGADRGVVWLTSHAVARGDFEEVRQVLLWAIKLVAGFTVLAGILAALIFIQVEGIGSEPVQVTGAVGLLVLVGVTFSFLQKGALLGIGAPVWSKFPTEVLRPLFMIVGVLIIAANVPQPDSVDVMWLTLFTYAIVVFTGQLIWNRMRTRAVRVNPAKEIRLEAVEPTIRKFGHFAVISASATVMRHTDVLLIGALLGPEQVATYSVAARVVALIVFVQRAASPVIQPIVSRAWARGELALVRETVAKTTVFTTLCTVVTGLCLLVFGRTVLSIFGPEFADGQLILIILLVGQVANVLSGPNALLLSMTNNQHIASSRLWIAMVANILGNFALIPPFGATGAAIATAFVNFQWNVMLAWACRVKLNIDPSIFGSISRRVGNG